MKMILSCLNAGHSFHDEEVSVLVEFNKQRFVVSSKEIW